MTLVPGVRATAADLAAGASRLMRAGRPDALSAIGRWEGTCAEPLEGRGRSRFLAIDAYRTVARSEPRSSSLGRQVIERGEIDAITFSSPSSVHNLFTSIGRLTHPASWASVPAICAGPITAAAARDAGLFVAAISLNPGPEPMAQAVVDTLSSALRGCPHRTASTSNRTTLNIRS